MLNYFKPIYDHITNPIILFFLIVFCFIIIMTILLNKVEKDRIPLMADFFEKVLASILNKKKQ